ncbi:uncharacterized protein LOC125656381 [Ostrea edulis]|uniref:uncharacterized protein LOC125656381 n=1 Tax=Ostrea edulis TaxID=37623 RepID=UPI0024AF6504|nr:uncharacterized protein LOC125656381 [Ostrea edulis]
MQLCVAIVVMTVTLTKAIDTQKSPYGYYDAKDMCFRRPPVNFPLSVRSTCQTPKVRRELEYALKKYPAVEESLRSSYIKCNLAYVNDIGLDETCPTYLQQVTQVYLGKERCDVVRPHYQCATFAVCKRTRSCAGPLGLSFASTCLYDGFRQFRVWVYCKSCGFKLIKLKLPQCCSCRKYKVCGMVEKTTATKA